MNAGLRRPGLPPGGGGTLSHAAIVGREYRVPAVTGVGVATLLIADGDEVEAVLAVERYYGYPVDVEWVVDTFAIATKYAFKR